MTSADLADITPERWARVKTIFAAALERSTAERATFLTDACASDPSLRTHVEAMLSADAAETAFLEVSALQLEADALHEPAGPHIGPYRIIREIGRGGMGVVYLAVREDDFEQRVALKLIKLGMDTELVLRRFRHERQILANLEHPNIARLLDGGSTAGGRPYFVMEYLEGQPITDYCATHGLTTPQRVEIFRTVCAAVHFAHQHLVIHRDIKPSNVLVTVEGVPKLLDFGIARLVDPDESGAGVPVTATELRILTPDYASPEQIRGGRLTTTSDVYSLGVLLYELLAGTRPYRFASHTPNEIEQVISGQQVERPSRVAELSPAVRRTLRGDLDTIVLTAMHVEPGRRYQSVEQFADDLARYASGLPVRARKDRVSYRMGKFVGRHRVGVATAALVGCALIAALTATLISAQVARAQRAKAEQRFEDVRHLANAVIFKYHDPIARLPGSTPVREMIVKDSLAYLNSLAAESTDDRGLQQELAQAYLRIGEIQGLPNSPNLGDTAGALASYRTAEAILTRLVASDADNIELRFNLQQASLRVADVLRSTDMPEAIARYRRIVDICEALQAARPDEDRMRRALSVSLDRLALSLNRSGDVAGALALYRRARPIGESLAAAHPEDLSLQRSIGVNADNMAVALDANGQPGEALEMSRKAEGVRRALALAALNNTQYQRDLSVTYNRTGKLLRDRGDSEQALDNYRRALDVRQRLADADPLNAQGLRDLSVSHERVANLLSERGRRQEANVHYQKSLAMDEARAARDPVNVDAQVDLSNGYFNLGLHAARGADSAGALRYFQQSTDITERVSSANPDNRALRIALAWGYDEVGAMLRTLHRPTAALEEHSKAARIWSTMGDVAKANADLRTRIAIHTEYVGAAHEALAKLRPSAPPVTSEWQQARDSYHRSLGLWTELERASALDKEHRDHPSDVARRLARAETALAAAMSGRR